MTGKAMTKRELQAWARDTLPLYDYIDLSIDSVGDGVFRCSAPLSNRNKNGNDSMHAMVIWALAELSGRLAMLAEGLSEAHVTVVRHVRIDFRRSALSGITAEVEFTDEDMADLYEVLESEDQCDFDVLSILKDSEGRIVAEATCAYTVRKTR